MGEVKRVEIDVKSYEEREKALTMLKILALGKRDIKHDKFKDAEDVFVVS